MAFTLGSVTLENVQNLGDRKTGVILPIAIPLSDADETEVFDLGANTEVFVVRGLFQSDTPALNQVKINALKALKSGNQSNPITYDTGDFLGSFTVKVLDVDINIDITDTPTGVIANYSVMLMRSKAGGP